MSATATHRPQAAHPELVELISTRALKRGKFTLASGREATFYLDAKQVVLDAHGSMLVGKALSLIHI